MSTALVVVVVGAFRGMGRTLAPMMAPGVLVRGQRTSAVVARIVQLERAGQGSGPRVSSPSSKAQSRAEIKIDMEVLIVEKHNQRSGLVTRGKVARILTNSRNHPRGIKVKLATGEVGRVQRIPAPHSEATTGDAG